MIQQLTSHREINDFLFINNTFLFFPSSTLQQLSLQSSLFINNAFLFFSHHQHFNSFLFSLHSSSTTLSFFFPSSRASFSVFTESLFINRVSGAMDLSPFKLDIDELINEFVEGEFTTLADMKRVWLSRKFTYIFEASPPTKLAFFMQSLYAHTIGHMISTSSLSQRLGGLYCLYCLYETQPFKPPFKIYFSLGELKKLKTLVINAKEHGIKVVPALVKRMLEKNMFLFGFVDLHEGSVSETVNQLTELQDARVQVAYKKLFEDTRIEQFLHMDMGMEFDLEMLKKMSTEYAEAKKHAIREANKAVDVQNIQHISDDREFIGDEVERITENWNVQRQVFYQQTGLNQRHAQKNEQHQPQHKKHEQQDDDFGDEFSHQLELQLIEEEQLQQKEEDDESNHELEL